MNNYFDEYFKVEIHYRFHDDKDLFLLHKVTL